MIDKVNLESVVSVQNISKDYSGKIAVRNLSMEIPAGICQEAHDVYHARGGRAEENVSWISLASAFHRWARQRGSKIPTSTVASHMPKYMKEKMERQIGLRAMVEIGEGIHRRNTDTEDAATKSSSISDT